MAGNNCIGHQVGFSGGENFCPIHRNEESQDRGRILESIIPENVINLKNYCYCFDLKTGCQLIALIEGIFGLLEAFICYKDIRSYIDGSHRPNLSGMRSRDPISTLSLGIISFIGALILLSGVLMKRKACLLFWLYVTSISTTVYLIYNISDLLIFDALSAVLESYFIVVVLAYYLQMRRADDPDDEFEVLFTASDPELAT